MVLKIYVVVLSLVVVYVKGYLPITQIPQLSSPSNLDQPQADIYPSYIQDSLYHRNLENNSKKNLNAVLNIIMAAQGVEDYRQVLLNDPVKYATVYKRKLSKLQDAYNEVNFADRNTDLYTLSNQNDLLDEYKYPMTK